MPLPDPRQPLIAAGWAGPSASCKPLQLLTAELFNRTFAPTPDGSVHVAPLKSPPKWFLIVVGVIAAGMGLIVWATLAQAGTTPSMQGPMPYIVAAFFGILGLFFLITFVRLLFALVIRGSWSNRQCIAVGRSGIYLRLQGGAVDIPWAEVTAVRAMFTNTENVARVGRAHIPVLRVEREGRHWDLGVAVLDASPVTVYTVLHYYWTHPRARTELGTTFAQQRMDLQAGYVPTTIAPGVTRYG